MPDTMLTPLEAAGAEYYPRLQEIVNDARAALTAEEDEARLQQRVHCGTVPQEQQILLGQGKRVTVLALLRSVFLLLQVKMGGDQFVHLSIRRAAGKSKLLDYQLDKTASDPLESL